MSPPMTPIATRWLVPVLAAIAAAGSILIGLQQPGIVSYVDATVHLCWLQAFHDALAEGVLQPRWSARDFHGLGAPVFVFYPPLAYYAGAVPMALGSGPDVALKLIYAAAALGTACFVHGWLRQIATRPAALALAALAAMLPQFVLFGWRFNMPASALAIPFTAFALWMLERVLTAKTRALMFTLLLALALALTILAHTISAALLVGLCVFAAAAALILSQFRRRGLLILCALALAAAATAFQWLPAVLSVDSIQPGNFIAPHAKQLLENLMFGSDGPAHWPERRLVDLANIALLIWLGFAILRITKACAWKDAPALPGFAAAAIVLFLLMTPLARPILENVDALHYLQFGWRWQPLFALCALRVIATAHSATVTRPSPRWSSAPSFALGSLLFALGVSIVCTIPSPWLNTLPRLSGEAAKHEAHACRSSPPEYLPKMVTPAMLRRLHDGGHWELRTISGRVRLIDSKTGSHFRQYEIEAELPSRIELRLFASPGWSATINDEPVAIDSSTGAVVVDLPAARSLLELRYE